MVPEEAHPYICQNREQCVVCNGPNEEEPLYCVSCKVGWTLQPVEGEESAGYCQPDNFEEILPEEAHKYLCQNRGGCKTCNAENPLLCDECNDEWTLQELEGEEGEGTGQGYCVPDNLAVL